MYMHEYPYSIYIVIVGFFDAFCHNVFWWRDVVREAEFQGHHTPIVQIGMRYGMMLFISSEVMFFVAFFWAFFDSSLYPDTGVWPPADINVFDPFDLPLINTMILLLSGCTVTWAHHALQHDNRKDFKRFFFDYSPRNALALQGFEYHHAAFGFTDGIYASTFYMATGFHGAMSL